MASVTVNLTGASSGSSAVLWSGNVNLGSTFASDSSRSLSLTQVQIHNDGEVYIQLGSQIAEFTTAFEATGRFIFAAEDDTSVEFLLANADMADPYRWTPTNSVAIGAFFTHLKPLVDLGQSFDLTLTDDAPLNRAPVITAIAADPTTVDSGGVVTLTATVTDPDIA